nr:general secretion pathway protein GspB [Desulfobulbaceae bacterium]
MSYILEAIKKADQKRKLGSVPDVSSEHGAFFAEGKRSLWPYWAALALFVNAGLIGWWLLPSVKEGAPVAVVADSGVVGDVGDSVRHDEASAVVPQDEVQTNMGDQPAEEAAVAGHTATENRRVDETAESQPEGEVDSEQALDPEAVSEEVEETELDAILASAPVQLAVEQAPPADSGSSKAEAVVAKQNASQPEVAADRDSAETIERDALAQASGDAEQQEEDGLDGVTETLDSNEQDLRVVGGMLTPEEEEAVAEDDLVEEYKLEKEKESDEKALARIPYYYQLPDAVQSKLPEIHISFHVYTRIPSERIVSVNGKVLREGQNLEREIKLEQITPLGIVLLADNRRFKVEID